MEFLESQRAPTAPNSLLPQLAFPLETLRSQGIPEDASVELLASGKMHWFGPITPNPRQTALLDYQQFEGFACVGQDQAEITRVVARFHNADDDWERTLTFTFDSNAAPLARIQTASVLYPVAVWTTGFEDEPFNLDPPPTVQELGAMLFSGGDIFHQGKRLAVYDDPASYPEYWVCYRGERRKAYELEDNLRREGVRVIELLDEFIRSPAASISISPELLIDTLRDRPDDVARLAKDFIARYGLPQAKSLFGPDFLDAALAGTLWDLIVRDI
jgi:hypothetical protein